MYHFAAVLVKVLWNNLNQTESSFSELEEHHKWKVVAQALGSSPTLPSNFGISEGSLVGTGGQEDFCFNKSGKFNVAGKGSLGLTGALKVPAWGLEGLAPMFLDVKVGLPVVKWSGRFGKDSIHKPMDYLCAVHYMRFEMP